MHERRGHYLDPGVLACAIHFSYSGAACVCRSTWRSRSRQIPGLHQVGGDVKNLVELVEIRDWSVEAFRVLSNIRWPLAASRRSHDRPRKPNISRSESNIPPTPTESPAQSATPWASASATLERKSGLRLRLCVARPSGWDSSMVCRVQISSLKVA